MIKTTIAATMFPHLSQRLFAGRSAAVVQRGLAVMGFTFFVVQLSSMVTGWCAEGDACDFGVGFGAGEGRWGGGGGWGAS